MSEKESIFSKLSVLPALIVWLFYWTWPFVLIAFGIAIGTIL